MFQRKRWLKLSVIAVLTAVGAAVAGVALAQLALRAEMTVALPGRPAGDDILNIRGADYGPCWSHGPYDYCVVEISCGTKYDSTGAIVCSTEGAHCADFSGPYNYYCQGFWFTSCTPTTNSCLTNSTDGCTSVSGGGGACKCQGTYPAWSSGTQNNC